VVQQQVAHAGAWAASMTAFVQLERISALHALVGILVGSFSNQSRCCCAWFCTGHKHVKMAVLCACLSCVVVVELMASVRVLGWAWWLHLRKQLKRARLVLVCECCTFNHVADV
jgi:hypothetical protein